MGRQFCVLIIGVYFSIGYSLRILPLYNFLHIVISTIGHKSGDSYAFLLRDLTDGAFPLNGLSFWYNLFYVISDVLNVWINSDQQCIMKVYASLSLDETSLFLLAPGLAPLECKVMALTGDN